MTQRHDRKPFASSLFVTGVTMVLASVATAVWMFRLGDIVTALGLGLLVVAGLLLAGIGLPPEAAAN
ncbi:hypothetical protein ACFO5R_18010 [Halosolutus amylolyticus]|uniref:Uncharacterized protein n=2 Tax=Halosolutus amylolyticus TaxID=2932267 RepID=A0ABD5PV32_9EURY|nr:hypothetical protein [Halosolutus amylolyticus]